MAKEREEATQEVVALYALAADIPELHWIVDTPITDRLAWPISSIRIWINSWKQVIEESYATSREPG